MAYGQILLKLKDFEGIYVPDFQNVAGSSGGS